MKSIYQNKTFANYWNKRAGEEGEVYKKYILDPIMFDLVGSFQNKVVLEVGCGNGYLAKKFLEKQPVKVILMDISEHNIEFAKQKAKSENLEFIVADATLPWSLESESIDIIYSNMMLNEVEDIQIPISEAYRVLKREGIFVFSVTHPAWDLFIYAQEKVGVRSKKIKRLGNYFRRGNSEYIMGGDSKTNPDLAKEYNQEFVVEHYQRPISDYFNPLTSVGFQVGKISEPEPTEELLKHNPRFKDYEDHPVGLIFFAIKH